MNSFAHHSIPDGRTNNHIMKNVLLVLSLSLPMGLLAQSPTGPTGPTTTPCPNPPCAPGKATTNWEGSIPMLRVRCENTSIFSCFTLQTPTGGTVTPNKIAPNTTGVLRVNDAEGKATGEQPNVKFISVTKDAEGFSVFTFNKL